MKTKYIAFVLIIMLIFSMVGCTSKSLPSGHARYVYFEDGSSFGDCEFEYVNEHTVKFVCDDGDVVYVPTSAIRKIWVEE